MTPTLDSQHKPLPMIHDAQDRVIHNYDTLGVIIGSFNNRYRVYLEEITCSTPCSKIKRWKNKLRGAYIVKIKTPHLLL